MGGQVGQIVRVVNRTSQPLLLTYDQRQFPLVPGYRVDEDGTVLPTGSDGQPAVTHLDYLKAEMAKRQNVRLGSENPINPRDVVYLVGIVEDGDDVSYLEQSDAQERLDRSLFSDDKIRRAEVVSGIGFPRATSGRGLVAVERLHYQDGILDTQRP